MTPSSLIRHIRSAGQIAVTPEKKFSVTDYTLTDPERSLLRDHRDIVRKLLGWLDIQADRLPRCQKGIELLFEQEMTGKDEDYPRFLERFEKVELEYRIACDYIEALDRQVERIAA